MYKISYVNQKEKVRLNKDAVVVVVDDFAVVVVVVLVGVCGCVCVCEAESAPGTTFLLLKHLDISILKRSSIFHQMSLAQSILRF